MNIAINRLAGLFLILTLGLPVSGFSMPESGETVTRRGTVDDDYYAAGGTVDLDAAFTGDVVLAGGDLFIGHRIEGDVIAAGGTLSISGEVLDDVRTAGGDITIDAAIGDDLIASGGRIKVSRDTSIAGEAWLAAGDVHFAGTVNGDLVIGAGSVLISGTVHGDVTIEAGNIQILDGALIDGKLHYRSPHEATIHSGSKITGQVSYEQVDWEQPHDGMGIFFALSMALASIVFYKSFSGFTLAGVARISSDPLKCLGAGLLTLIMVPLVSLLLISILLGVWIGLSMMALYFVALLSGMLVAFFFVSDWVARRFDLDITSSRRRLLYTMIAIFVTGLLSMIPLVGGLLLFALLLLGLGAVMTQLMALYKRQDIQDRGI